MKLHIKSGNAELSDAMREWTERRIAFALGQFGDKLRNVNVVLSDLNGPKGGLDQRCLLTADIVGATKTLTAEVCDTDPYAAVSRAADRMGRRIRDQLDRSRSNRRSTSIRPNK